MLTILKNVFTQQVCLVKSHPMIWAIGSHVDTRETFVYWVTMVTRESPTFLVCPLAIGLLLPPWQLSNKLASCLICKLISD